MFHRFTDNTVPGPGRPNFVHKIWPTLKLRLQIFTDILFLNCGENAVTIMRFFRDTNKVPVRGELVPRNSVLITYGV